MKWLTANLYELLPAPWAAVMLVIASVACGTIVGIERDRKEKPVGFRTLTLVSLGATVFTMISIALGDKHDAARIAAQIVTGIGFLGAGAILHGRFGVSGLTSAATIWVMAAAGMVVGAGYAGAGLVLSALILAVTTVIAAFEQRYVGRCQYALCVVRFSADGGKTSIRLEEILDEYDLGPNYREKGPAPDIDDEMHVRFCRLHKHHRAFLTRLAEDPAVREIRREEIPPAAEATAAGSDSNR